MLKPLRRRAQAAHQALSGQEMRLSGQLFGADNEFFVNQAHVPCVCMGAGLGTSHSDCEYADGASVAELARQMLLSILHYYDMV